MLLACAIMLAVGYICVQVRLLYANVGGCGARKASKLAFFYRTEAPGDLRTQKVLLHADYTLLPWKPAPPTWNCNLLV